MAKSRYIFPDGVAWVTAPPMVHFAFNPWYFDCGSMQQCKEVVFDGIGETREPYGNSARFDLRRWVQKKFDGVVESSLRSLDYTMTVPYSHPCVLNVNPGDLTYYCNDEAKHSYTITDDKWNSDHPWSAIWGAAARGEEYGGDETLRWWYRYPFTIDVLTTGNDGSRISFASPTGSITITTGNSVLANPAVGFGESPDDAVTGVWQVRIPNHVHLLNQELTEVTRKVTLLPDCAPVGQRGKVYLRWIDSMGRIRYWLFTQTDSTEAVTATAWNRAEMPEPELYEDGVNDAQPQRQELTAVRTRTLAAPLLSEDDWAVAGSVVRSPLIDEFDGYGDDWTPLWHRVNVVAGSYTRGRQHLQDLTFQITDRTQTTQSF